MKKLVFLNVLVGKRSGSYTEPKDLENIVTYNYSAKRLFSVTKVYIIDSLCPAAIGISNEIG
jgi:hypothetical protein